MSASFRTMSIGEVMSNPSALIVDDMPANLKLIRLLLAQDGFSVRTAEGASEAVDALASFVPDIVLTDIQLPGITGLELTRMIRSDPRTKDIVIVGVSANAMRESIEEGYSAGCDGYITKPIDTRTFAASVLEYLERGRRVGLPGGFAAAAPAADARPASRAFTRDCR